MSLVTLIIVHLEMPVSVQYKTFKDFYHVWPCCIEEQTKTHKLEKKKSNNFRGRELFYRKVLEMLQFVWHRSRLIEKWDEEKKQHQTVSSREMQLYFNSVKPKGWRRAFKRWGKCYVGNNGTLSNRGEKMSQQEARSSLEIWNFRHDASWNVFIFCCWDVAQQYWVKHCRCVSSTYPKLCFSFVKICQMETWLLSLHFASCSLFTCCKQLTEQNILILKHISSSKP